MADAGASAVSGGLCVRSGSNSLAVASATDAREDASGQQSAANHVHAAALEVEDCTLSDLNAAAEARAELTRLGDLLAQETALRDRLDRALFEERQGRLALLRDRAHLLTRLDLLEREGGMAKAQRVLTEVTAGAESWQHGRSAAEAPQGAAESDTIGLAALRDVLQRQLHRSLENDCRSLNRLRAVLLELFGLLAFRRYVGPRWIWRCALVRHSALFDVEWYLRRNPDVAAAGVDPVMHYLMFGAREGREPSPVFCGALYLWANPDVAKAGVNPLIHYLCCGRREGRAATAP